MRYHELFEFDNQNTNSLNRPISFTDKGISNFKSWFGNSKIVDKEKRPLVVFHATTGSYKKFDNDQSSKNKTELLGYYFTDNSEMAASYVVSKASVSGYLDKNKEKEYQEIVTSKDPNWLSKSLEYEERNPKDKWDEIKEGGNIKPCYLRILKPLVIDAKNSYWNELYVHLKGERNPDEYTTRDIVHHAYHSGKYDGVIFKRVIDYGSAVENKKPSTVYVAFHPSQIKSALTNTGEYGINNYNIDEEIQ